jgi:hypothetical protein
MKALVMAGQWIGIVGTRYINSDQDLSNGRPNTPVTRQLKYTVPEIFYLLEISAPQFQASTQALDAGVFGEKCSGMFGYFLWRRKFELLLTEGRQSTTHKFGACRMIN